MNIGIFGGSFNPIHNGHIALARQLLTLAGLDEVWFMVSPQNPLKQARDLLPDDQRLDLVRQALADVPGLVACDYEFRLPRPSYTWNTLQSLSRDYPYHQFSLIIGGDNWKLFPRWYHAADILRNYQVVVYPRKMEGEKQMEGGESQMADGEASKEEGRVVLVQAALLNVSSTMVRRRVRSGKSITGLVPPQIEAAVCRLYQ